MDQFLYWLAQGMGILITVLCIVTPLFKRKWHMLVITAGVNLLAVFNNLILSDFVLGSATILCAVAVVQAIFNYVHTVKEEVSPLWEKILFTVLYLGCGIFGLLNATNFAPFANAENIKTTLIELLPVIGALFLMISVFAPSAQGMRKFSLLNASIWTVYYGIIGSTTIFAEIFAIATTCFALYKYRQKPAKEDAVKETAKEN